MSLFEKKPAVEEMTDHEMLMELVRAKRRDEKIRLVKLIVWVVIAAVIIIALMIYLPPVIDFFKELQKNIKSISDSLETMEEYVTELHDSLSDVSTTIQGELDKISDLIPKGLFGF